MIPLIVIGAIALLPVLLALVLRVNGLFVFLAAASGYFLQYALSDDVDLALAAIIKGSDTIMIVRIALLLLPVAFVLFALRKTMGKGMLFQLLPLVFTGLFIATLALPLLPPGMEDGVYEAPYGSNFRGAQDLIIAAAVASNLALLWSANRHKGDHKKHH